MASTFSLQGKLGLDARDFKKGAGEASDAIQDVADELDDLPDQGATAGGKTGDLLSSGLAKGFAAAGGTALIAMALNEAMDIEAGVQRVQAQFALTAEEAERYGKLGGDLYANAWGESSTDATASVAKVGQQLQDVGAIADDELAGITANVMAVADVFQQDFDAVVRSTGQLLRNGLAADAEEALDLVTVAFQEGGDRAGDLLDTIDEYSQHWAALGIDGSEALGLIIEGFQQGFRDGDKLADLLKEFGLRSLTDEAVEFFDALGLAGTQMQDAFGEGGEAARDALGEVIDALDDVEDPIERNRIAVGLFGTQWEDLGPKAIEVLQTLETGLGDVEGAATDMAETVSDTTAASFEEMKRRGVQALAELAAEALPFIQLLDAASQGDFSAITSANDEAKGLIDTLWKFNPVTGPFLVYGKALWGATKDVAEGFRDGDDAAHELSDGSHEAAEEARMLAMRTFEMADGSNEAAEEARMLALALDDQTEATDAATEATIAATTALMEARDSSLGYRNQIADTAQEIWDAMLIQEDATASDEAKAQAARDAEAAVYAQADAAVRFAEDQAIANGESWTAADANAVYRAELQQLADKLTGPARQAILDHIAELDAIPEQEATEVTVDKDAASQDARDHKAVLDQIPRNITTTVTIQQRNLAGSTYGGTADRATPENYGRASGGPVIAGRGYLVGEEGPEWFEPKMSGYVHNHDDTIAMFARSTPAPAPAAITTPTPASDVSRDFANGTGSMVDPAEWGRQAADAYSRRMQLNARAN